MRDPFREFYERAGKYYPEDELTYSSISGLLRKKWIMHKIETMPAGNLLDCGCNVGRLSAQWKKGSVFGIDIARAVLQRGRELFPETNFIHGDLRSLEFIRHDSIDNTVACEVIEHLDKPLDFLQGLYTIMKKGGLVLITAPCYSYVRPNLEPLGVIRSYGLRVGTDGDFYLHTAYKPHELAYMAQQVGFEIIETGSFEFEMRGWTKPLTILENWFRLFSKKSFSNSRINILAMHFFESLKINLFYILETFSFSKLLRKFFKEGRRSYILAKK